MRSAMTRRGDLVAMVATALVAVVVAALAFVERATAEVPSAIKVAAPVESRCAGDHWVGAWLAAPQGSSLGRPDDLPWGEADGLARTFTDRTLRMVVTPNRGGSALRVHLGNTFGTAPVTIGAASIASRVGGASARTLEPLTFAGSRSAVLDAGERIVSDPLLVSVAPFEQLVVSIAVDGTAVLDHHQWAQVTSYATPPGSGDHVDDVVGTAFTEQLSGWYGVAGIDVLAPREVGTVVALGDSLTDGIGSTPQLDRRWPDQLARRIAEAGVPLSVVNAGISGNHVTTSGLTSATAIGPSALDRFDADALAIAGVTDVLVFEGVNDIYLAAPDADIADQVIDGYESIVARAHEAGLRVIGTTITPASMAPAQEASRLAVNRWIRTSGAFDEVVDFDAVVRDPAQPSRLVPAWDAGMAHMTDAGYAALAAAIPLDVFQGTDCSTR